MPLIKKDGLPEKAREIIDTLKFDFNCQYDEKDSLSEKDIDVKMQSELRSASP